MRAKPRTFEICLDTCPQRRLGSVGLVREWDDSRRWMSMLRNPMLDLLRVEVRGDLG